MRVDLHGTNVPELAENAVTRDTVIWRYLSIGKYLDFITRGALWFTRAIELRRNDPYEANYTPSDFLRMQRIADAKSKDKLRAVITEHGRRVTSAFDAEDVSLEFLQWMYLNRDTDAFYAHCFAVSCWHENAAESDAMWALYARRDAGIAIKTTVGRVADAFGGSPSKGIIAIGRVLYDSEDNMTSFSNWMFDILLIKRHAFKHENEVRLIVDCYDGFDPLDRPDTYLVDPNKKVPPGRYVSCIPDHLSEKIVLSPLMPDHCAEALASATQRFCPKLRVERSPLYAPPDPTIRVSDDLQRLMLERRTAEWPAFTVAANVTAS